MTSLEDLTDAAVLEAIDGLQESIEAAQEVDTSAMLAQISRVGELGLRASDLSRVVAGLANVLACAVCALGAARTECNALLQVAAASENGPDSVAAAMDRSILGRIDAIAQLFERGGLPGDALQSAGLTLMAGIRADVERLLLEDKVAKVHGKDGGDESALVFYGNHCFGLQICPREHAGDLRAHAEYFQDIVLASVRGGALVARMENDGDPVGYTDHVLEGVEFLTGVARLLTDEANARAARRIS
jgi:hypothetical protein